MPSCAARSTSWRRSSNPRHTQRPFHNNTESGESRTTLSAPFFYPDGILCAHTLRDRRSPTYSPATLLNIPLFRKKSIRVTPPRRASVSHPDTLSPRPNPSSSRLADLTLLHPIDLMRFHLADLMRPHLADPYRPCRPNRRNHELKRSPSTRPLFAVESTSPHTNRHKKIRMRLV